MVTIYKYEIDTTDEQKVFMPFDSQIISVVSNNNRIYLYALVRDDEKNFKPKTVYVCGTGHPADHLNRSVFLGTVLTHEGKLVWHVFISID